MNADCKSAADGHVKHLPNNNKNGFIRCNLFDYKYIILHHHETIHEIYTKAVDFGSWYGLTIDIQLTCNYNCYM